MKAEEVIEKLNLAPLEQEGGWFARTYTSAALTAEGEQAAGAIYYLIQGDEFSHLHRLDIEEVYHFYLGDPVELVELLPDGTGRKTVLGQDIAGGQHVQKTVLAGTWQGSRLAPGGSWALMGTTTCPAYEDAHYEHGDPAALAEAYPAWIDAIAACTASANSQNAESQ